MRFIYFVLILLTVSYCGCKNSSSISSISLFNGSDLTGWHIDVPEMDTNNLAQSPFIVKDQMIVSLGTPGGHLITDASYSNYRISCKYRFSAEPGNCGILVHATTPRALYEMFPKSIEAQLMHENAGDFWVIREDITCDNMVERRGPKEEWGSTEGTKRRIPNLTDGSENPVGEWNEVTVECFDNKIKVWINDDLVNYGYDCTTNSGQIALQSEGSEVEFKDIKLTPITAITE